MPAGVLGSNPSAHWLGRIVAAAGFATEALLLDGGMAIGEAWSRVCAATGLGENGLTRLVAEEFGLAVADFETATPAAVGVLPEHVARRFAIYPLRTDDGRLTVATADPTRAGVDEAVRLATRIDPQFEIAAPARIESAIAGHYPAWQTGDSVLEQPAADASRVGTPARGSERAA